MCDLQGKLVFATVGTTKFDLMIKSLTQIEVLQVSKFALDIDIILK